MRPVFATGGAIVALTFAARAGAAVVPHVPIALVSGRAQSAHAYIAQHGNRYEAQFTTPLVVRVGNDATVRFRCTTADCTLPPQEFGDNSDNVNRVDTHTFDVKSVKGTAQITLLVSTPTVEPVTILAQPTGTATGASVTFILTEQ